MSWGVGFGGPWGNDPLVASPSMVAPVSGAPIVFDFSDEPNGPLPGLWDYRIDSDDGNNSLTTPIEPDPTTFFKVLDGKAWWNYLRDPANPGPGDPFDEHGVIASPNIQINSRNARLRAIFTSPHILLGNSLDAFHFELTLAYRGNNDLTNYSGGRIRAEWQLGTWTTPQILEIVKSNGSIPSVIGSVSTSDHGRAVDSWSNSPRHELEVRFEGNTVTAKLDGGAELSVSADSNDFSSGRPIVIMRAFCTSGTTLFAAAPALEALEFSALRDSLRRGSPEQIAGDSDLNNYTASQAFRLPIHDLIQNGYLKQLNGAMWECISEVDVNSGGPSYKLVEGDIFRSVEPFPYIGQNLVSVMADYGAMRSRRER